jgi:hypothetical protein
VFVLRNLAPGTEPPTAAAKKTAKGVFKPTAGTVLNEDQAEAELSRLNPMSRPAFTMPGTGDVAVRSIKTSYVHSGRNKKNEVVDLQDEDKDDEDVPANCSNSTGTFAPPYWSFIFSDVNLRDHVCLMVSMPSGLLDRNGLDGKVDATVSTCKRVLEIACEWPESMTKARCMQDALSVQWNANGSTAPIGIGVANTVSNILQAFEKELRKIRIQNKVTANDMLGSTVKIPLPFEVESDMVLCQPNLERKYISVILYVVLKKTLKKQDQFSVKRMSICVSGDYENVVPLRQPKKQKFNQPVLRAPPVLKAPPRSHSQQETQETEYMEVDDDSSENATVAVATQLRIQKNTTTICHHVNCKDSTNKWYWKMAVPVHTGMLPVFTALLVIF